MRQTSNRFLVLGGGITLLLGVWVISMKPPVGAGGGKREKPLSPAQAKEEIRKAAPSETAELAHSCNEFALELYRTQAIKQTKDAANFVVAPYSIAESLAMMHLGARGETATEIAKTLHLKLPAEKVAPVFASLGIGSGGHLAEAPPAVRFRFGVRVRDGKGGAEITEVKANSPAHEAGLQPQDIIVRVGNGEVRNATDYANALDTCTDFIEGEIRNAKGLRAFAARLNPPASGSRSLRPLIANAIWGRTGLDFLSDYKETLGLYYRAAVETMDFQGDPAKARAHINHWVAEKTDDNIQDLLPTGAITKDTGLVLTNAIFFHADWAQPFHPKATAVEDFFAPGKTLKVPMMHKTGMFRYGKGNGFEVVQLPYEGDFAMVLLLPGTKEGLAEFEKNHFTLDKLSKWFQQLKEKRVLVSLPRFTVTAQEDLNSALTALGMPTAFSKQADFSGMSKQGKVGLSNVVHKAQVQVYEEGTRASAGTASTIVSTAAPDVRFRADHPFLFLIRDTRTGVILFVGRVVNPNAEK